MYCRHCGTQIQSNSSFCTHCGKSQTSINLNKSETNHDQSTNTNSQYNPPPYNQQNQWPQKRFSAGLMAFVSFLIVGLGQMIMGQVAKGVIMLLGSIVLGFFTFGLTAFLTIPFSIIDAYKIAERHNRGEQVGDWDFF